MICIPDSLIKDTLEISLCESGALEILVSLDLLGTGKGLLVGNGLHSLLSEGFECSGILAKIELGADQNDGDVGSVMIDLGIPLER